MVPTRRPIGGELALVVIVALAVLLPGVWSYALVDPWETHYAEVARRMLQGDGVREDWVHLQWQDEGFRSKPVLTFWLMAASMKALGVADGGGYSGELVSSPTVMLAIRLPFVLFGVLGLAAGWWMLARLVSRRVAWLGLGVLATTPFYLFVARQGITDMTLVGSMIGAIAMFAVAAESGDEPLRPLLLLGRRRPLAIDARHVLLVVVGGLVAAQAIYYAYYFAVAARPGVAPATGVALAAPMLAGLLLLVAVERLGPVGYWIVALPALPFALARLAGHAWHGRPGGAELAPVATARQVYLLWCWTFLGISVLGKGLPALAIVGVVCLAYVALLGRWRDVVAERFELVRGFAIIALVAVPWHVAMAIQDGARFTQEYFVVHLWNRAAVGVHGDKGTFDYYLSQLGYGLYVWAALAPAAIVALVARVRTDSVAGRARLVVAIWAVTSVAFFSLVQTKFHHYILPAVPALAFAIALWLDDVLAGRARHVGVAALVGAAIVLLLANDMIGEPKQWIELFVYRYDRPWPSTPPWEVDVSGGFLATGVAAALALGLLAVPRLARVGVAAIGAVALAAALWSMHGYMPVAAQHWGMRDAIRQYYDERELHGARLVYHGARQVAADWASGDADGVRDAWILRTRVPAATQEGQPMVLRITVKSPDARRVEQELRLVGRVDAVDPENAEIRITLPPAEQAKLARIVAAGAKARPGARPPIRAVDADRLIAWQLYWRGENFWSGDEIWGPLPELQTAFKDTDNVKFLAYIQDRALTVPGRRYWVITEAGRVSNLKSILPTANAKETFRVENTSSNKFTLASFVL